MEENKKTMPEMPVMLTIREASRLTGLPDKRLRKMILAGEVAYYRAGSRYYLNADSLRACLEGGVKNA